MLDFSLYKKSLRQQHIFTANHVLSQGAASEPFICFFFLCIFVDEVFLSDLIDLMMTAARGNYSVFLSFMTKKNTVITSINIEGITPCVAEEFPDKDLCVLYHMFRTEKAVKNCLYMIYSDTRYLWLLHLKVTFG